MIVKWINRQWNIGTKIPLRELGLSLALAAMLLALSLAAVHTSRAAPLACVAGPHSGNIAADQEWCAADNPPIVNGSVSVAGGVTLTVEAGVEIRFNSGTSLNVNGTLIAEGTNSQPITFTSSSGIPSPGYWGTINVNGGSHVRLAYCDVGYGGGAPGNRTFYIVNSDVQIRHCRIHHNSTLGDAVRIEGAGLTPLFEDVEIDHNTLYPIHQSTIAQNPTYLNVRLHDNGTDALLIDSSSADRNVTLDGSPAALNGAPIFYGGGAVNAGFTLTVTAGTTLKMGSGSSLSANGTLIAEGTPTLPITFTSQAAAPTPGNWSQIRVASGSHVRLAYCDVDYAGSGAGNRAVWISSSDVDIHRCRIHHSLGDGVFVDNSSQIALQNVAVLDSGSAGLSIMAGARIDGVHLTLAHNGGGVYVAAGGTVALTNTILAQNATGVNVVGGGSATLVHALWDNNTTPTVGTVNETGHVDGPAAFDTDGYHVTRYSAALEQSLNASVTDDIDGQARPLPAGTLPDLGADEYPYSPGTEFVAEKAAFEPQWVVDAANPYGRLQQRYLVRFYYGSTDPTPPDLTVTVTDTLPAELGFRSESHSLAMGFQRQGQQLTWQTASPIHQGQSGEIQMAGIYDNPEPGRILTNTAALSAGAFHFDLQAITRVPVIAPLIVFPGNGELCPGSVVVSGTAQAGVTVTIYANGSPVAQVSANVNGIFATTYNYPGGNVTLKAQACANGGACSSDSNPVALTPSLSFWCPQRSTWEGTPGAGPLAGQHLVYRFRDGTGKFSTQNWVIPGIYGFWNTALHLYVCNCPPSSGTTAPPSSVWVVADGVRYDDLSPSPPWYDFAITGGAHTVHFYAQCGSTVVDDDGTIMVDPDGYVFDVTQSFTPTLHAVSGVTVTCMVSMPEWGGWVPWPAYLYNNQVNPQVTGADGYFAFFTPPGLYYLQVEDKSGYQPWRSPVIEVITQIVHANVPYTPWPAGDVSQVTLAAAGPNLAVITVTVGDSVEWLSEVSSSIPPEELVLLTDNPLLRPLSDLDPLYDTRAWDGGTMAPGRVYRRQFTKPGTYSYTDGMGHTGQVVVVDQAIAGLSAANDSPTTLGQPTTLTATVTAGTNVVYTWAFGDITTGTGAVVTHTYPAVGVYTATVTASNGVGVAAATTRVTIEQGWFYIYLPLVLRSQP